MLFGQMRHVMPREAVRVRFFFPGHAEDCQVSFRSQRCRELAACLIRFSPALALDCRFLECERRLDIAAMFRCPLLTMRGNKKAVGRGAGHPVTFETTVEDIFESAIGDVLRVQTIRCAQRRLLSSRNRCIKKSGTCSYFGVSHDAL